MGMPFTGNLPPSGIISTPATNLTISTGEWVDFNGAAADPDQNLPLTFHWNFGDPTIGNAGTANPAPVQFNHPGTYTATFTVTDSLGVLMQHPYLGLSKWSTASVSTIYRPTGP